MAGMMSRGDRLLLGLVLAFAGVADAAYLTWEWYAPPATAVCDITSYFSCSRVRDSPFSAVAGVPTALVGLVGFLILAALLVLALRGRTRLGPLAVETTLLAFAIVGALVGVGLSLIEVFLIEAVCVLCALGFALDVGILVLVLVDRRAALG